MHDMSSTSGQIGAHDRRMGGARATVRAWGSVSVLVGLLAGVACEESTSPNLPPSVAITDGAMDGETGSYLATFEWQGSDPDGVFHHYLYAIETLGELRARRAGRWEPLVWTRIDATSGTFEVPAELPGEEDPFTTHDLTAFHVKAVDDDGAESVPDVAIFDATNIAPYVSMATMVVDAPGPLCASTTVRWSGWDGDAPDGNRPVGYQVKLIAVSEAAFFDAEAVSEDRVIAWLTDPDSLRPNLIIPDAELHAPYAPTDWYPTRNAPLSTPSLDVPNRGATYTMFAVRGIDAAGAVTPPAAFGTTRQRPWEYPSYHNIGRIDGTSVPRNGAQPEFHVHVEGDRGSLDLGSALLAAGDEWRVAVPYIDTTSEEYPYEEAIIRWAAYRSPVCDDAVLQYNFALNIGDPDCYLCDDWSGWNRAVHSDQFALRFFPDDEREQHVLWIRVRDREQPVTEIRVSVRMDVVAPER